MHFFVLFILFLVQLFIIFSTVVDLFQTTSRIPISYIYNVIYIIVPCFFLAFSTPEVMISSNQKSPLKIFYIGSSLLGLFILWLYIWQNNTTNFYFYQVIIFNSVLAFLNLFNIYREIFYVSQTNDSLEKKK